MPTVPNFLCIGSQRSGTSWFAHNLKQHPQIWMPPIKELHFFDTSRRTPLILHAFEQQAKNGRRVRFAFHRLRQRRDVLWVLRYLLIPRIDRWYPLLFTPRPDQICGEATPDYARMDKVRIRRIKALLPDLRLIYLLRDPVQCAWSQAAAVLTKSPNIDAAAMNDSAIDAWIKQHFRGHIDYLDNLQRWETVFQRPVFMGFFQQIVDDPEALLTAVFNFLGVDPSPAHIPADVRQARNSRAFRPMPAATALLLTERFYPQIVALHEHFGNSYTAQWLADAEHRLSDTHAAGSIERARVQ